MTTTTDICTRLSLERCRQYIAHIHALIYMEDSQPHKARSHLNENLHSLLSLLDQELQDSQRRLAGAAPKTGAASRRKSGRDNVYPFPEQTDVIVPPHS